MSLPKLYPDGHPRQWWVHDPATKKTDDDREPRPKGCLCHLEYGDSPCPVHVSDDDKEVPQ